LENETLAAEKASDKGYCLNLATYLSVAEKDWVHNFLVFSELVQRTHFDLLIGDESYPIVGALLEKKIALDQTFVSIYDFLGTEVMTKNPLERLRLYFVMRVFSKTVPKETITYLFVGEELDVPDRRFGLGLPNRREWAREHCNFIGYVFPFDPGEYSDSVRVKEELGYGAGNLIVCSIGGTAVGKELLELCGRAYPIIKQKLPDLQMVLVCGPRLDPEELGIPEGPEVRGYVPDLYEHFAASDLAIVQGGGTSTLELTALKRPFLCFPLEKHFEQQVHVTARLRRHRAGVQMQYSQTTPESLAEAVLFNLGKEVDYPPIRTDGAKTAAQMINRLLR
jgi:hypothetical protein